MDYVIMQERLVNIGGMKMREQAQMTDIEEAMSDSQRRNWAWRRWTARGIDEFVGTLAVFSMVMSIGAFISDSSEPSVVEGVMALVALALILLTLPLSIFASSVQYALFGGTFGKWICGVRVSDEQGNKPTRWGFFWRDIKVLVRGEWLRLWVLALIGNVIQYNRIVAGKPASYEASSPFRACPTREGRWYDILLVLLVFVLAIVQFVLIQIMYA